MTIAEKNVQYWQDRYSEYVSRKRYSSRHADALYKMVKNAKDYLLRNDSGQDIAEYAVLLAVILVIVIGTIRLIGTAANNTFSAVASGLTQ